MYTYYPTPGITLVPAGNFRTWYAGNCRGYHHQLHYTFLHQIYKHHGDTFRYSILVWALENITFIFNRWVYVYSSIFFIANFRIWSDTKSSSSVDESKYCGCLVCDVMVTLSCCHELWLMVIWMISAVVCGWPWLVISCHWDKMSWLLIYDHNNHHSYNQSQIGKIIHLMAWNKKPLKSNRLLKTIIRK